MQHAVNFIRKSILLKVFIGLLLIITIIYGLIYNAHPIISKWIFGAARIMGKPIGATVYTNGHINKSIEVYRDSVSWHGKKINGYLLMLKALDKYNMLKFIYINLDYKFIGRPNSVNEEDYDSINGVLLQSDTGDLFDDFRDDMKSFNFDPHLHFTANEIKFNIPPKQLKFDSVRIELNKNHAHREMR